MLSKEEIENKLEQTEDDEITINLLYQKVDLLEAEIEQLESEKQKLIEKLEEDKKEINKKIKKNNKIINMEWLDSKLSMNDYFARKNKTERENEILEMKIEYLKSFSKIVKRRK